MARLPKPSGGRTFSKTCLIRGREAEGRWAILKPGTHNTSVARIGPDGLTTDERDKVSSTDVVDIRPVTALPPIPSVRSRASWVIVGPSPCRRICGDTSDCSRVRRS